MGADEKPLRKSPLRAEEERLAASFGAFLGCNLPVVFPQSSDIATEIRVAREAVAVFDTNFRGFLSLSGPDRVRYLNAVTTADIKSLAEGQGNVGLLLNPQGHILAEIETYALADSLLLVTHVMTMDRTHETLDRFIIMDDCKLEKVSARYGAIGVGGPKALSIMEKLCGLALESLPTWSHAAVTVQEKPCRIVRRSFYGQEDNLAGFEIFAEQEKLGPIWQAMVSESKAQGGGPVGMFALNCLRVESGIPWFGYDFDDKVIPHEAGIEHSHISYTKGCYTGQEIVERVRSRGHVNRHLVMLSFSLVRSEGMIALDMPLSVEGKEVGRITSVAFSGKGNKCIGMGYVRLEHASPGSRLDFPGGTAQVIERPTTAAGAPALSCQ